MRVPAFNAAFGFPKFTALSTLKNSDRNCNRKPSRPGSAKFLNNPRLVVVDPGPSSAFRPVLPYVPAAGEAKALRSNQARILSSFERSLESTGCPTTAGRWLGVPLSALSTPVVTLKGRPERVVINPFTCQ